MTAPERDADLASFIDHTLLRPNAGGSEVEALCAEAAEHGFAAVCVASRWVATAAHSLRGSPVSVCSVVGFPHGDSSTVARVAETAAAVRDGANEIDVVIALGPLCAGDHEAVARDLRAVAEAADGRLVKVILETCQLSDALKRRACELAVAAGAHFVKTSTGFGTAGATEADVALMRATVGPAFGVKASGGMRDAATARAMIRAGANRIGASRSVAIVRGT